MRKREDLIPRIGRAGLVLLAALAPSLLGGYPLAAASALTFGALLLFILAASRPRELTLNARLLVALSLASLLAGLFQLLPMPAALLRVIAPEAIAERAANYTRLGLEAPHLGTISRAPYEGNVWIIRAIAPIAVFFASLSFIRRPDDRRFIVRALVSVGAAFALVGLAHRGLGAERLFGIYAPVYAHPELLTPLLNSNHLAGLFVLTSPLALGLAMSPSRSRNANPNGSPNGKPSGSRGWALAAFFLMSFALLLTGSRGGVAAYLIGLALFALLARSSSAERSLPIPRPLFFTLWGVAGLIGLRLGAAPLLRELHEEAVDAKLILFERGLALGLDAPLFGYGRGAFGVMMSDRYPYDEEVRFAENALLQRAADLGLPLTLLLIGLSIYLFLRAIRGRRSTLSAALIAGLVGLSLQNLVDYSLELPGLAIPAALALGALIIPRGREPERAKRWTKATLIGLAACLSIAFASAANFTFMHDPVRALDELSAERALPSLDDQRRLYDAHPRSAGLALGLAHFYRLYAPERAGPHLNRALELAPFWSRTHVELARWLLDQERPVQAGIHLREAAAIDHRAVRDLICAFIRRGALEEAVEGAPSTSPYDARYLDAALRCISNDEADSRALESLILERSPDHLEANLRAHQRSCRGAGAESEGAEGLRALSRAHPRDPRPALALLACLKVSGDALAAEKEAKAIVARMPYTQERVREILSR